MADPQTQPQPSPAPAEEARSFTPLERAAIVLASLDRDAAAKILRHVNPKAVVGISKAIQSLGVVDGRDRDAVVHGCLSTVRNMDDGVFGTAEVAQYLLKEGLNERELPETMLTPGGASEPGEDVDVDVDAEEDEGEDVEDAEGIVPMIEAEPAGFSTMANMDPREVADLLAQEQPGVISMVLRRMPGEAAGAVLDELPIDVAKRSIVFLCTSRPPSDEVARRVEAFFDSQFGQDAAGHGNSAADRMERVTGILQSVTSELTEDLLSAISEKSGDLAETIRDRLFTFEDIERMGDMDMRRILAETDMAAVAVALRGTTPSLREKFLANMSKRAAEGLREEMQYAQRIRMSEVQTRRREIVDTVRRLEAQGQVSTRGEEYV